MLITRGDYKVYKFQRLDYDGNVITDLPDSVTMTVRKSPEGRLAFKKSLGNGIIFNPEDNFFYITILPADTQNLEFGEYGFDIEVTVGPVVHTILPNGHLEIGVEYSSRRGGRA